MIILLTEFCILTF